MTTEQQSRLEAAETLLRNRRTGEATAALRSLTAEEPNFAAAHYQLALALGIAGDKAGAESQLRSTLKADPSFVQAAAKLADLLNGSRRHEEALVVVEPLVRAGRGDIHIHTARGVALKALSRFDDAAAAYREAAAAAPGSGVAEHNLAGLLGDAHRFAESEAATRRALAKGLDAPETWLVRARALQGLDEFEEAEAAFRQAIQRRPAYADAHGDLAQLIWMRTEDVNQASAELDAALAHNPADPLLSLAKSKLLDYAGDRAGAYATLSDAIFVNQFDAELQVAAAQLRVHDDPQEALSHAERAVKIAPDSPPTHTALAQAYLAVGRADAAAAIAEKLCQEWPLDQFPVAVAATAWRILGDPRYHELYNYERVVRVQMLETPAGWSNLAAFLSDLAAALRSLQRLKAHPIGQSLRSGTQTGQSLAMSDEPVIKALFGTLDAPIRHYIRAWKSGDGGRGDRDAGAYRLAGAWSAMLRPGGFHTNHLHPLGWISSACHIEVPKAVDEGRQGWLTFGEPGIPTQPPLPPEHFVKPRPGDLVLFPSYMWHGTMPFTGETPRLSVAFDILPG